MTDRVQRYGSSTLAKVSGSSDLRSLLDDPWLESETIIVKPNWVVTEPAAYTDHETLRILLEALDSEVVVVEGYQIGRSMNELEEGLSFTHVGREVNWLWLMRGGWGWLSENSDWGWFREGGHWNQLRKEEKIFLDDHGFTDLFQDHGVEYVNVTEEIWRGKTVDEAAVKEAVEGRFNPVSEERLYGFMPERLHRLWGSTLVSFAKAKCYATFTLKNLFGLIPDPLRAWWHGPGNSRFDDSVIGINKVYASTFNVYGICEALLSTAVPDPNGAHGTLSPKYRVEENLGVVALGRDMVSLDAVLCGMLGYDLSEASYLTRAEELGTLSTSLVDEAKADSTIWFPFRE